MVIYILFPGDTEEQTVFENRQLGEFSYPRVQLKQPGLFTRKTVFYTRQGYDILIKLIQTEDKRLEKIRIMTEKGKSLTVEKFLDDLTDAEIRYESKSK